MARPTAEELIKKYGSVQGGTNMGYPSDKPCCLCGGFDQNQSEPRFGHTVCISHQHVPPLELSQAGLTA